MNLCFRILSWIVHSFRLHLPQHTHLHLGETNEDHVKEAARTVARNERSLYDVQSHSSWRIACQDAIILAAERPGV